MIKELSRMGAYHAMMNGENQDALCHGKNRDLCVITLADGVSECKEAKTGAVIASRSITDLFLKKGHYFLEFEKEQIADLNQQIDNLDLLRAFQAAGDPAESKARIDRLIHEIDKCIKLLEN